MCKPVAWVGPGDAVKVPLSAWIKQLWQREPVALVSLAVAVLGLFLGLQERLSRPRACESPSPEPVAELRLALPGRLQFEVRELNQAKLQRVLVSRDHGKAQKIENVGNGLTQLIVEPRPGSDDARVIIRVSQQGTAQELSFRAFAGSVKTCVARANGERCLTGPVTLTLENARDAMLLSDGTRITSASDRAGSICWGAATLQHLKIREGQLRIRR
jgi:hypothetical protein